MPCDPNEHDVLSSLRVLRAVPGAEAALWTAYIERFDAPGFFLAISPLVRRSWWLSTPDGETLLGLLRETAPLHPKQVELTGVQFILSLPEGKVVEVPYASP